MRRWHFCFDQCPPSSLYSVISVANVIIWGLTAPLVFQNPIRICQYTFWTSKCSNRADETRAADRKAHTTRCNGPICFFFLYPSSQSALLFLLWLSVPPGFKTESVTFWLCHEVPGVFVSKAATARGYRAIYNLSCVHNHSCRMATMKSCSCKAALQGMWNMTTMH